MERLDQGARAVGPDGDPRIPLFDGAAERADIAVLEIQGTLVKGLNVYSNEMIDFEGYDTVVLAAGSVAHDRLYFALKGQVRELYRIGDCVAPRKTDMAIVEGNRVGRRL